MAYTPTIWKDGQAPALNAENLNKMEQGIAGAQNPYTAEQLLSDTTRGMLGLGTDAVPDDAFVALILGQGVYGYRVKVQLEDGTPVEGSTISGIEPLTGSTLVSGADGIVLGKSTSKSVTISCTSPYVDYQPTNSQVVPSTGTITDVTIILDHADIVKITSSTIAKISHLSKTVDITAVGGGGGGGGYDYAGGSDYGGGGGGGGNIEHALNVKIIERSLEISVGSGGLGSGRTISPGNPGGVTSVKFQSEPKIIVSASGGGGGGGSIEGQVGGASTNGGKGGKGGRGRGSSVIAGEKGFACTEHIFGDNSLDIAGSGGGGGGGYTFGNGGSPNGGAGGGGGLLVVHRAVSGTAPGGGGGGGGGGSGDEQIGSSGGSGGVYLRFHY